MSPQQHTQRGLGMLSTRNQVATRELAADHYGAQPPRGWRGQKSSRQQAETTATQSKEEKRRRSGGAQKLALLHAARGLSASNRTANNLISRSHTAAGRQGNARCPHHCERNGIDPTELISPSHTGACRSGKMDPSTTVTETRSSRSQPHRCVALWQPAPQH